MFAGSKLEGLLLPNTQPICVESVKPHMRASSARQTQKSRIGMSFAVEYAVEQMLGFPTALKTSSHECQSVCGTSNYTDTH